MDPPEETRELPDVTIRAQETSPGFFVASYHPTSPETHPARQGFSIDTKRGLRGKNLAKVLDFAEAYWLWGAQTRSRLQDAAIRRLDLRARWARD